MAGPLLLVLISRVLIAVGLCYSGERHGVEELPRLDQSLAPVFAAVGVHVEAVLVGGSPELPG